MKNYLLLIFMLLATSCTLYEVNERLLAKFENGNGAQVEIYYVTLGATANDVIQVRKSKPNQKTETVKFFEKYNYLESSKMLNDTSLQIVLSDTGYKGRNRSDTVIVYVK